MDHAAMVMVLQALREVKTELRTMRQTVEQLTQTLAQSKDRARAPVPQRPHSRTVEFPRAVEPTRGR